MTYFSLFILVFTMHVMAVMSPGPDFILVLKNAVQHNRKIAIITALGISLGIGVHIIYALTGIALLLKQNETLFSIVKIIGGLYIIYIGIKTIMQKQSKISIEPSQNNTVITKLTAFKTGFITNVLNPKASLFFLSLFTIIIPPETPFHILVLISLMVIVVTFIWFTIVSIIFTNQKIVTKYLKYENVIVKIFGIALIVIGIAIFFEV